MEGKRGSRFGMASCGKAAELGPGIEVVVYLMILLSRTMVCWIHDES